MQPASYEAGNLQPLLQAHTWFTAGCLVWPGLGNLAVSCPSLVPPLLLTVDTTDDCMRGVVWENVS